MVSRINMDKGVFLGYGNLDDLELVGRAFGYDIHIEQEEPSAMTVWVYERNVTKRFRRDGWSDDGKMETRYRIVAKVDLTKLRRQGAWHVDMLKG